MKQIIVMLLMVFAFQLASLTAHAQGYKLGLGIRLSNVTPTLSNSLSVKYFIKENRAIDGLVSFGGSRFGIGGLFQVHNDMALPGLKWYYGGGAYVGFQDGNTYLGPTGTVGLDYKFETVPLNISLDWKPELDILPGINFIPDAFGLSVRFTLQ